jgi:HAD superfamily hydrolase (TIGR01509 family)
MNKLDLNRFDAVIFDMDGVLVDSEPLWKIAMYDVFTSLGSKLTIQDFQKTVGMRIDQVISYWKEVEKWKENTEDIENQIINKMIGLINANGQPLPGVKETTKFINQSKKTALASSSPKRLIDAVLHRTKLSSHFHGVFSAESEIYGKPHPAVFLTAASFLNINPSRCLVIEDSLTGIIAGKAANMTVVCIPEKTHSPNPKLNLADYHFNNMSEFLNAVMN